MQRKRNRPAKPRHVDPPCNTFPTSEEIADRAHEIFLRDRTLKGSRSDCWRAAEDELLDRAAQRAIGRVYPARRT